MKIRLTKIFILFLPAVSLAAPLGFATGNYGKDLGQIQGVVDSFKGQQTACTEMFPVLKEAFSKAMADWEFRNRTILNEVSMRVDDYMNEVAEGNLALVEKQKIATEESNRRNLAKLKAYLASLQPERAREICSQLTDGLNTDMSVLEDIMKFQFETVRSVQFQPTR